MERSKQAIGYIGKIGGSTEDMTPSYLAEFKIFNKALTEGEVQFVYNPNHISLPTFSTLVDDVALLNTKNELIGLIGTGVVSYNDLTDLPTLFNDAYGSLSGLPTLFNGAYGSLSELPTLFNGAYGSLSGLPTLFNGDYNSLDNKLSAGTNISISSANVISASSSQWISTNVIRAGVRIHYTGGNVGIGTNVIPQTLSVVGNSQLLGRAIINNSTDGGTTRGIMMWNSGDTNWGIYMAQSGEGRSFSGATACNGGSGFTQHAIRFRVANTETQGFIFENNNDGNSAFLFSIRGSDGRVCLRSETWHTCSNNQQRLYFFNNFGTVIKGAGTRSVVFRNGADTNVVSISDTGKVRASDGFENISDMRIKKEIEDVNDEDVIAKLLEIETRRYRYIHKGDSSVYGFIAQQIKEVMPYAVSLDEGDLPDGTTLEDFHYLDKSHIFTLGFSATQILHKRAEAQRIRVEELETKLAMVMEHLNLQ